MKVRWLINLRNNWWCVRRLRNFGYWYDFIVFGKMVGKLWYEFSSKVASLGFGGEIKNLVAG